MENIDQDKLGRGLFEVKWQTNNWVFQSIRATYEATMDADEVTPLVAFMLISCFIDFYAGFYCGIKNLRQDRMASGNYKAFLRKYLTQYNADNLYSDLRSRLTHNFYIGSSYELTHKQPKSHNPKEGVINFENFFLEFQSAVREYLADVEVGKDADLQAKFLTRCELGMIGVGPIGRKVIKESV